MSYSSNPLILTLAQRGSARTGMVLSYVATGSE